MTERWATMMRDHGQVIESNCNVTRAQMMALAQRTAEWTDASVIRLMADVSKMPLRHLQDATHFRRAGTKWTPCAPDCYTAEESCWTEYNKDEILLPPITLDDFIECMAHGSM